MFQRLIENVLAKARTARSDRYRLVSLVLDEMLFLFVVPWMLILPAWILARLIPWEVSRPIENAIGAGALFFGLTYSMWAVSCQWRIGQGTPALSAPTRRLVITGPYRLSRNPIQLGALLYVMGLGTLCFSITTGAIACAAGLIVGIIYIKNVEEKEMAERFGAEYKVYKSQTPFLIPFSKYRRKGADCETD